MFTLSERGFYKEDNVDVDFSPKITFLNKSQKNIFFLPLFFVNRQETQNSKIAFQMFWLKTSINIISCQIRSKNLKILKEKWQKLGTFFVISQKLWFLVKNKTKSISPLYFYDPP